MSNQVLTHSKNYNTSSRTHGKSFSKLNQHQRNAGFFAAKLRQLTQAGK